MPYKLHKITITAKKLHIEFYNDNDDPVLKTVEVDGVRSESLESHVDAIMERAITDALEVYEEKKNQMTMFDDSPEEVENMIYHEDSDIPDFSKVTKEFAALWIEQNYTGEDGERSLSDLFQDVKYNTNQKMNAKLSLEEAKKIALELLYDN